MKLHLVHGIHTATGDPAVQRLLPFLTGWDEVVYPDYGYILAVETKRINPVIVGCLKPYIGPDDVMIGHSNGCAAIYDLLQAGVKMKGVVFLNGALRQDVTLPDCVKFCHVYFNEGDDITEVAQAAARLGVSVDANWGQMGHAGYLGTDPRVENFNCGSVATSPANLPLLDGHSDLFTPGKVEAWGPFVNAAARLAYLR